jgi:subtilase family serine protease
MGRFRLRLLCLTGFCVALFAVGAAASGKAGRVVLPNAVPSWIAYSTDEGPAGSSVTISFRLYLAGRAPAAEKAFATEVSSPGSRRFRQYVTPSQFFRRFGPSSHEVHVVTAWARDHGLVVTGGTAHYLALRGSAPAISRALDTRLDSFQEAGGGTRGYAPVREVSVPSSIGPDVLAAVGLDNDAYAPVAADRFGGIRVSPKTLSSTAGACSSWWGQHRERIPLAYGLRSAPTAICGYGPAQLRSAYGVSRYTGRGATVAIVLDGHLPTMLEDANRFFVAHHTPGFAPGQYRENFGPGFAHSCGSYADLPEEPLDVETVHIIAPDAKVVFVAANCDQSTTASHLDFLDAETRIVDQHLADVETDSFSTLESQYTSAMTTAWSAIFEQGAAEGIGFNFDSGDGGDETSNDPAISPMVTFPASDPWATAVGGTTLEIGRSGHVVGELGWGDTIARENRTHTGYLQKPPGTFVEGSTGGRSALFAEPPYQRGVVPARLATAGGTRPPHREVPDVAALASPITGWLIAYTMPGGRYQQIVEGGTSGSSPIIAALEADAKQASGHAVGFANPTLYALRHGAAIRDIVTPRTPAIAAAPAQDCYNGGAGVGSCLVTLGLDSTLRETPGYDDVTGVGSASAYFINRMGLRR